MRHDVHIKPFARIVLAFDKIAHRRSDHVRLVVRGNEIGDPPLFIALRKLFFGQKRQQNIENLQNNGKRDQNDDGIIDDAQYPKENFIPHGTPPFV